MTQLVRYDAARTALAEARSVDEVKDIRDKAEALRSYARQAGDIEMQNWAAEIKVRAERRAGEFLLEIDREQGLRRPTNTTSIQRGSKLAGEIERVGIGRGTAVRWQQIARIPQSVFEPHIACATAERRELTSAGVRKLAKRAPARNVANLQHPGGRVADLVELADRGARMGCIYADPPWLYGNQSTRGATDDHYAGMTVDQICKMPIARLGAANSHLHLWTTNAFLFEAKRVIEAWGFEYRSCFVWVKPTIGMGNYWRVSHEFLLLGIRGSATFPDRSLRSWGEFKRGRHSAKPEQIRVLVERVSPGPRLELFARREAPGWYSFGNEIERSLLDQEAVA